MLLCFPFAINARRIEKQNILSDPDLNTLEKKKEERFRNERYRGISMKSTKVYTVTLFFFGAKTKYNKAVFPTQTVGLTCVSRNINQISLGSVVPLPP